MTDRPLSSQELFHSTWSLLHSVAAHFPKNPTEKYQKGYLDFFETFGKIYPDRQKALKFQELVKQYPPQLHSREALSIWLCKVHNVFNQDSGKQEFPCRIKDLDRRWKKGPPECYGEESSYHEEEIVF